VSIGNVIRVSIWALLVGLLMAGLTIGASPATFATIITTTTSTKPPTTTTTKYTTTTTKPTTTTTKPTTTTTVKKVKCNAGRGNGPELVNKVDCDPGNSGGHNQGGD